ncbi:MAG: type II toxin-antitoxin system RelE/ParE family toxin [Gemmatimonadales bacterium]|nr:MAG: type II toxin-antitoxin system RelE/ParE family toxin [Gemmatimonadales bacterium]
MATREIRWHPRAITDAEQARDWYARRSPLAARAFLLALDKAVEAVRLDPERWPASTAGCRRYLIPGSFPYGLIFRVHSVIEVVAVAHERRRPGFWAQRGSMEP